MARPDATSARKVQIRVSVVNHPVNGDVLITHEAGRYCLSVIPHPHRLTFAHLADAVEIAVKWAASENVSAWQTVDNETVRLRASIDNQ